MQSVQEPQVTSCLACCHFKLPTTSSPVTVLHCAEHDSTGVSSVADWSTMKRAEHWDLPRNGLQAAQCSAAQPEADRRSGAGPATMGWSWSSSRCCQLKEKQSRCGPNYHNVVFCLAEDEGCISSCVEEDRHPAGKTPGFTLKCSQPIKMVLCF